MAKRAKGHPKPSVVINAVFGALLLIALVTAGLNAYQTFDAEDDSMSPAINEGDHFLFSKHSYDVAPPQLGDIIVFTVTKLSVRSVRRVVGLPGDRVQMIGHHLTINGHIIGLAGGDGQYGETLPNGATYEVRVRARHWNDYWTPQYLVPEGHYFVLGDNRDYSHDSRDMDSVGFVASEQILGKVMWRFWDGTRQQIDVSAIK